MPLLPSDAELVEQALAGSQAAYRALVARYATPAINLAARMVRNRALAEDMAQDAFARAFGRLSTYDPQHRFAAWFFQILHNVTVDYLRRRRLPSVSLDELEAAGHPGIPSDLSGSAPDEQAERAALARDLDTALTTVRPEYREAVVLRYREDLSVQDIAMAMGVPVGTVKTYLHRARKELAVMLGGRGWGPAPAQSETPRRRTP